MVRLVVQVKSFLENISSKISPLAKKELAKLEAMKVCSSDSMLVDLPYVMRHCF
jgi:Zn-dependent oligopeptidase